MDEDLPMVFSYGEEMLIAENVLYNTEDFDIHMIGFFYLFDCFVTFCTCGNEYGRVAGVYFLIEQVPALVRLIKFTLQQMRCSTAEGHST